MPPPKSWEAHRKSDARPPRADRAGPRNRKPAPNALVRIGFPMPKDVSRRIRTMRVVEGDMVSAGALLAELDTSDFSATLQQLQGEAAVVEKRLERSDPGTSGDPSWRKLRAIRLSRKRSWPSGTWRVRRVCVQACCFMSRRSASEAKVAKARLANAEAILGQVKARFQTDFATLEAQLRQANAAIRKSKSRSHGVPPGAIRRCRIRSSPAYWRIEQQSASGAGVDATQLEGTAGAAVH